jgi:tRNA (uracil-5-)-methyltransferase
VTDKYTEAAALISTISDVIPKYNLSPSTGFRSRCEFGYRNDHYTMVENGNKVFLKYFNIAHPAINKLMPKLLAEINKVELIKHKLFQINFRCNNKNKVMVTFIYHKEATNDLFESLKKISSMLDIHLILRSKKKYFSSTDDLLEEIICSKKPYSLFQTDQTFFQPNRFMVPRMVNLVCDMVENPHDLLELYCGCGTFTIPLSGIFTKIFATENNRKSIMCLDSAIEKNNVSNINYARLSCDEVMKAINGQTFRRLKDIDLQEYNFSHILLDPPRSGLTNDVIELAKTFDNILYISCNVDTFVRDMKLLKGFEISKLHFFDQFVNTQHLELVSIINRK